jgi:hypothetical protein
MAFDPPRPGQVILYPYLWWNEQSRGLEEGRKNRPVAVVYAGDKEGNGRVYVLPISSSPPREGENAIEIPTAVAQHLRLDAPRSWIKTSELNHFEWPGPDLSGQSTADISRGFLPYKMTSRLREMIRERVREKSISLVDRDVNVQNTVEQSRQSGKLAVVREPAGRAAVEDARRQSRLWQQRQISTAERSLTHNPDAAPKRAATGRRDSQVTPLKRDRDLGL